MQYGNGISWICSNLRDGSMWWLLNQQPNDSCNEKYICVYACLRACMNRYVRVYNAIFYICACECVWVWINEKTDRNRRIRMNGTYCFVYFMCSDKNCDCMRMKMKCFWWLFHTHHTLTCQQSLLARAPNYGVYACRIRSSNHFVFVVAVDVVLTSFYTFLHPYRRRNFAWIHILSVAISAQWFSYSRIMFCHIDICI